MECACKSLYSLVSLTNEEIKSLTFKNTKNKQEELEVFECATLCLFQEYFHQRIRDGCEFKTTEDFKQLDPAAFDLFCITYTLPSTQIALLPSPTLPAKANTSMDGTSRHIHEKKQKQEIKFYLVS